MNPDGKAFPDPLSDKERNAAFLMQQIWFGALISWMSKVIDEDEVIDHVKVGIRIVLRGSEWPDEVGVFE